MKKASAILTSDWHATENTPICRTDDYQAAFWFKVKFISDLKEKHNCPIINSGDLFDYWKSPPALLREAIEKFPFMYAIPGQHDLPQHRYDLISRSSYAVLQQAGKLLLLELDDKLSAGIKTYSQDGPMVSAAKIGCKKVAIVHTLTLDPRKSKHPAIMGIGGRELLRKLKGFDLVLVGDNHQTFTVNEAGRVLVNPGSLMRSTADQVDHKPCVFLWYADTNEVEPVYLPIQQGVISREHIERVEQREARIDAFVRHLQMDFEVGLNFRRNLEQLIKKNDIHPNTQKAIWEAVQ